MSGWELSTAERWILAKLKARGSTPALRLARSWVKLFGGYDEELERVYFQTGAIPEGLSYWRGRSKPSAVKCCKAL